MRINKVKTRRGKNFLEDRAPKLIENDKKAIIVRGTKASEKVTTILNELYYLKKPMASRLMRKNQIHPFEDETMLCRFSQKHDCSLFVFGYSTKKRPNTLVFGRMFDHQLLDMVEFGVKSFKSNKEFKSGGVTLGVKPCVLLQGPLFESDESLKRIGNLMVDWFRGAKVEQVCLQGLELVISLTATSEDCIHFRVYKTLLKKDPGSTIPQVELVEIGPSIDFQIDRKKLASDSLFKESMKKPKLEKKSSANKNVKFDAFGSKVAKVHTGRQQTEEIQTRKVKALKKRDNVKRFDEDGEAMEE